MKETTKLGEYSHPDYEQFNILRTEPRDAPKRIIVTVLETYCNGMFTTYECLSPKWKVVVRVLTLNEELKNLRRKIEMQHQMKRFYLGIINDIGKDRLEYVRTLAIHKALSIQRVGIPLDYTLFRLDLVFFNDCYIYFYERTMPLKDFVTYVYKHTTSYANTTNQRNSPDFYTVEKLQLVCREMLNRMHNMKIVHMNLNEEHMGYSMTLHRPVWEGFNESACYYEMQTEQTIIKSEPPDVKYQTKEYQNCRAMFKSPEMVRRYTQYELNLYANDGSALCESLKAVSEFKGVYTFHKDIEAIKDTFSKISESERSSIFDLSRVSVAIFEAIMLSIAYDKEFNELVQIAKRHQREKSIILTKYELLAQLYAEQKREQDSYKLFRYMNEEQPNTPTFQAKLAEICLDMGKFDEAEQLIRNLSQKYAVTSLLQAKLFIAKNQLDKAELLLRKVNNKLERTSNGPQVQALFLLSEVHRKNNDVKQAIICLRQCESLVRAKNQAQLLPLIETNLTNLELRDDPEAYLRKCSQLVNEEYQANGPQRVRLLPLYYNQLVTFINMGDLERAQSIYKVCKNILKRLKSSNNKFTTLFNLIAVQLKVLRSGTELPEVESDEEIQFSADKLSTDLYLNKCVVGKINSEHLVFRSSSATNIVECRKRLALRYLSIGSVPNAQSEIEKASSYLRHNLKKDVSLQLTIDLAELLLLLMDSQSTDSAQRLIDKLDTQLNQSYFVLRLQAIYFYFCGMKLFKICRWRDALDYLNRSRSLYDLQLHPSENNRKCLLERIDSLILKLYQRLSMHQRIKDLYTKAIQKEAQKPDMFRFLADLSYKQGDLRNAIANYKRYIKNIRNAEYRREDITQVECLIADCYRRLDDRDSALQYYLKVEALNRLDITRQIAQIYQSKKLHTLAYAYLKKLDYHKHPPIAKDLARLCTVLPGYGEQINGYLTIYINWLDRDRRRPQTDPDVYEIMTHIQTLSVDHRILCLTKYLTLTKVKTQLGKDLKQKPVELTNPKAYRLLADLHFEKGEHLKAKSIYEKLAASDQSLAIDLVGKIFDCSDTHDEKMYIETLKGFEFKLGELHPQTMRVLSLLAHKVFVEQHYLKAALYYLQTLKVKKYSQDQAVLENLFTALQYLIKTNTVLNEQTHTTIPVKSRWMEKTLTKLRQLLKLASSITTTQGAAKLEHLEEFIFECLLISPTPRPFLQPYLAMAENIDLQAIKGPD